MNINYYYRKYAKYLINSRIKISPVTWMIFSLFLAIFVLICVFYFTENIVLSIISFVALLDIFIGLPIFLEESRVANIEKHLPNALREMADILKSGGTYEYALRELTTLDFGALNGELEKVLIRLEEGSNFEDALSVLGSEIDSELVKKVVSIIIDSVRAGAGLADVLEDISDDARQIYKLEQDRKAKTTMQVLFIFAAGAIIAPAIFGLVITIVTFLISVASDTGVANIAAVINANQALETIQNALIIYLFFEALASSLMVALMRDKSMAKAIMYLPMFLVLAYDFYYIAMFLTKNLLIGMI